MARDGRLRWKLVVGGQPLSPARAPDGTVIEIETTTPAAAIGIDPGIRADDRRPG